MDADRFSQIKKILSSALDLPEAERMMFLQQECGSDTDLLREVRSFLSHDDNVHALFNDGRWIESDISDELIGTVISHYEILNRIGEGGMGIVYGAEDIHLRRRVALKFLPSSMMRDDAAKDRFIHEARAAAVLDHPNICTVYEISDMSDFLFIAMAYIEGETLAHVLTEDGLSLHHCVEIAIQIANGLQTAHSKGVIHRDIKPGNIMITPGGLVKIMDFGLAKTVGCHDTTVPGKVMGTAAYMSPEQASGERVDHRTDLWSLGVVLYEMICGSRPFDAERQQIIIHRILETEPICITEIRPDVPEELERIVHCALAKSLSKRYQYAADMYRELSAFRRTLDFTNAMTSRVDSSAVRSAAIPPLQTDSTISWMQRTAIQASAKPRGFEVYSLSNLPAPLRGFIGRQEEIEETKRLIKKNRLVTIYGHDGVGKSRLAIQTATELVEVFPDGTYFVPLSVITEGEMFWRTLTDALSLRLSGSMSEKQLLLEHIHKRSFLIVLDEFKTDIHTTESIEILLDHAPGLKIIVTSLNPLNLSFESLLHLEGMNYPDGMDSTNPWVADSVRLYMQAARIVNPEMEIERENMNAILCSIQHLQGEPLAIELMASWSQFITTDKIPGMIKKLIGIRWWKRHYEPNPECILSAILYQSWKIIPVEFRDILPKVSIFRGGFRKTAAEEIAGIPEDLLDELVRHSFLRKSRSGKYEMHGVVREFIRRRLRDRGTVYSELRHSYIRFFTNMLVSAHNDFRSSSYKETTMRIAEYIHEIDYLLKTIVRDHHSGIIEKCLPGLASFYDIKHWYREAELRITRILKEFEGTSPDETVKNRDMLPLCLLKGELGVFKGRLGQDREAVDLLCWSIDRLENLCVPLQVSHFMMNTGHLYNRMGNYSEAYDAFREGLRVLGEHPAPIHRGYINLALARISRIQGNAQGIEDHMEAFSRFFDDLRERHEYSYAFRCLNNLRDAAELDSEWFSRSESVLALLR